MLICREQKNPVEFYGRKITLSEQALNTIYEYCSTPVTSSTIGMYVFAKFVGTPTAKLSEQEIVDSLTDEQIAKITEDGIKEEILRVPLEKNFGTNLHNAQKISFLLYGEMQKFEKSVILIVDKEKRRVKT